MEFSSGEMNFHSLTLEKASASPMGLHSSVSAILLAENHSVRDREERGTVLDTGEPVTTLLPPCRLLIPFPLPTSTLPFCSPYLPTLLTHQCWWMLALVYLAASHCTSGLIALTCGMSLMSASSHILLVTSDIRIGL